MLLHLTINMLLSRSILVQPQLYLNVLFSRFIKCDSTQGIIFGEPNIKVKEFKLLVVKSF